MQGHFEFVGTVNYMVVGENEPVSGDKEPRSAPRPSISVKDTNIDDAGRDAIDRGGDGLRIGIGKLVIAVECGSGAGVVGKPFRMRCANASIPEWRRATRSLAVGNFHRRNG